MVVVDIIKISLLLVIGLYASYTDILKGIIPNKLIVVSATIGLVSDVICYAIFDREKILVLLLNIAMIWTIAIGLYLLHIWAGGDSKLLCVIALLYPVGFYWTIGDLPIQLLVCVSFMFIYGLIYLIIESVVLFVKNRSQIKLKREIQALLTGIIRYIRTMIYMAAINHIVAYFLVPHIDISRYILMIICIVASIVVNKYKIFSNIVLTVCTAVFDLVMVIFTKQLVISKYWWTYAFVLLLMIINILVNHFNHQEIETDKIKKGMVLSTLSSISFQNSRVKGLPKVSDESLASRISEQEAESIRRWKDSKSGTDTLVIVRKVPFAIFILCGMATYFVIGVFLL